MLSLPSTELSCQGFKHLSNTAANTAFTERGASAWTSLDLTPKHCFKDKLWTFGVGSVAWNQGNGQRRRYIQGKSELHYFNTSFNTPLSIGWRASYALCSVVVCSSSAETKHPIGIQRCVPVSCLLPITTHSAQDSFQFANLLLCTILRD